MDRSSNLDTLLILIMPLINQQSNGIKAAGMDIAVLVSNAMPGSFESGVYSIHIHPAPYKSRVGEKNEI
jgi:hypothetical protein